LIFKCEEKLDHTQKIYSCFADKKANNDYFNITKGANISTSVMVCIMSYFTAILWAVMLFYKILSCIKPGKCFGTVTINMLYSFISLILAVVVTALFTLPIKYCKCFQSKINRHIDLKELEEKCN
jgi:hypothetical protein